MIQRFQEEAYAIMTNTMGLRRNIRDYLLRLLSSNAENARRIARTIMETCVFNLGNFLLQYMTKNLTQQAIAEMLLQMGVELYEQLSKDEIANWVQELQCRKNIESFFADFLQAIQLYLRSRGNQLGHTMLETGTVVRLMRSVQERREPLLQLNIRNCKLIKKYFIKRKCMNYFSARRRE